jgi:osmotically-inducible protein OsmY
MNLVLRRIALVLAVTAGAASLTACFSLVLGGAVVGGMVATDRRTSGTVIEDEGIEFKASSRIRERMGDAVHVNVNSYNRQVLLTGEVSNAQDIAQIQQIVAGVDNVRNIVNELAVMGVTSFAQRSSDALVTGQVKARLLDANDLNSNAIRVFTERGTTYLMGRVTQREMLRATELAGATSGVQRIVRVFDMVTEEELQGQPAPVTK